MNGQRANGMSVKDMAAEMIDATRAFVTRALKPFEDRIAELEHRAPIPGKDGKSITVEDVTPFLEAELAKWDLAFERRVFDKLQKAIDRLPIPKDGADGRDGPRGERGEKGEAGLAGKDGRDGIDGKVGKEGPPGRDGKDGVNGIDGKSVDLAEVERLVIGYVQKAVGSIPAPRDGRDGRDGASVSVEAVEALVRAEVTKAVSVIPAGKDGKDAPHVDVDTVIAEVVKRVPVPKDGKDAEPIDTDAVIAAVVKQIPVPKDGKDAQPIDVDSVIAEVTKRIPAPKDGQDGKSFTIEDVTSLLEAEVSKWELNFERRAFEKLQKAIDKIPLPKDGADGKDGRDGFGIDDFKMEYDGERRVIFKWSNSDREQSETIRFPINIYRQVFKPTEKYEKDDTATYGGSLWIAQRNDPGVPGHGDGWKLAVKKGQDAK